MAMAPKDDLIHALRDRFGEHAMDAPAGAWDAISSQLALGVGASTDLLAEFFHDRFQTHEADVDPGVWDAVQNSLSNFSPDSVDQLVRNRFQGHEVDVPTSAWEAISSQLGQGVVATGMGISTGWLAASLAGLAGIGALVWQLGGTEPASVPHAATSAIGQTVAPATAGIRKVRPVPTSEALSGPSSIGVTIGTSAAKPASAPPPTAPRASTTPPAEAASTPTNAVSTPLTVTAEPTSVEPSAPERMAPNQVVPIQPSQQGHPVVATVLEQMGRPQESPPQHNEPETASEPAVIEPEEEPVHAEELHLFVPNVFSPNGDGENEHWEPMGSGYQRVMVRVFNPANGTLVFRSNDLRPWDGLDMTGQPCPSGTYLYAIELVNSLGHLETRSETIALYR